LSVVSFFIESGLNQRNFADVKRLGSSDRQYDKLKSSKAYFATSFPASVLWMPNSRRDLDTALTTTIP